MKKSVNGTVGAVFVIWTSTFVFTAKTSFAQGIRPEELARLREVEKQFEQQWGPQFRQLHKTELHFMRVVCQPTRQQFDRIAVDSEPAMKATMRKLAQGMQRGRFIDDFDPRTPITDAVAKSVRST